MTNSGQDAHPEDPTSPPGQEPTLVVRLELSSPPAWTLPAHDARRTRVTTEGSVYELDPASMTVIRFREAGSELRRDGEPLILLSWPEPVVGAGMVLHLMVREDGIPTTRLTTPVLRITTDRNTHDRHA